ncbi:hypothetical protein [Georgenia alba]|uniref:Uncharacterized protein n=1 Tax=Georgenia alba TaxID=2233858 RepID=A0ABW2Q9H9_9MICO
MTQQSWGGPPNQPGPPNQFQQPFPQSAAPRRGTPRWIIAVVLGTVVVAAVIATVVVVQVLGTDPNYVPPEEAVEPVIPDTVGEFERDPNYQNPFAEPPVGSDIEEVVGLVYNSPTESEFVDLYRPSSDVEDVIGYRDNPREVGSGVCVDNSLGAGLCAITRGGVVLTVNGSPAGSSAPGEVESLDDARLMELADQFAAAMLSG